MAWENLALNLRSVSRLKLVYNCGHFLHPVGWFLGGGAEWLHPLLCQHHSWFSELLASWDPPRMHLQVRQARRTVCGWKARWVSYQDPPFRSLPNFFSITPQIPFQPLPNYLPNSLFNYPPSLLYNHSLYPLNPPRITPPPLPPNPGTLCGDCQPGYGVTFDLRSCQRNCGPYGILLFLVICLITPLLSLAVLYFDFPLPNELKGVIFYAQVRQWNILTFDLPHKFEQAILHLISF